MWIILPIGAFAMHGSKSKVSTQAAQRCRLTVASGEKAAHLARPVLGGLVNGIDTERCDDRFQHTLQQTP